MTPFKDPERRKAYDRERYRSRKKLAFPVPDPYITNPDSNPEDRFSDVERAIPNPKQSGSDLNERISCPNCERVVDWHPRYCPECGDRNASFEDQVKCKGCGLHLGSEEFAKTRMKVCPNCGETHYEPVPGYTPVYSAVRKMRL